MDKVVHEVILTQNPMPGEWTWGHEIVGNVTAILYQVMVGLSSNNPHSYAQGCGKLLFILPLYCKKHSISGCSRI